MSIESEVDRIVREELLSDLASLIPAPMSRDGVPRDTPREDWVIQHNRCVEAARERLSSLQRELKMADHYASKMAIADRNANVLASINATR